MKPARHIFLFVRSSATNHLIVDQSGGTLYPFPACDVIITTVITVRDTEKSVEIDLMVSYSCSSSLHGSRERPGGRCRGTVNTPSGAGWVAKRKTITKKTDVAAQIPEEEEVASSSDRAGGVGSVFGRAVLTFRLSHAPENVIVGRSDGANRIFLYGGVTGGWKKNPRQIIISYCGRTAVCSVFVGRAFIIDTETSH